MDHSMSTTDWDYWDGTKGGSEESYEPWPVPSSDEMMRRKVHRQSMEGQTGQLRRINPHQNDGRSIVSILKDREINGAKYVKRLRQRLPTTVGHELQLFAEYYSVTRYHSSFLKHLGGKDKIGENGDRPASSEAISTISIAFSNDTYTMASTHGDHTVKITCCSTGRLLATLEGHPRTPWTVKYHPIENNIVASGCLGFQVRVWDWNRRACLHMIRLDFAIISLSFHPSGHILAVASGSRLHFWDFGNFGGRKDGVGNAATGAVTEIEQRNMLRCVHFPPDGTSVIVGGMNPGQDDPRRSGLSRNGSPGGGISFYLRLWDFDLDAALHPVAADSRFPHHGALRVQRKPLTNARMVVPRALLYNDGGFDVSADGKTLCACAEYWLPDGVNNAMDLLCRGQVEYSDGASLDGIDPESAEVVSKLSHGSAESQMPYLSPPRQRVSKSTVNPSPLTPSPLNSTVPVTPPNASRERFPLSPPSPPGRRWPGGLGRQDQSLSQNNPISQAGSVRTRDRNVINPDEPSSQATHVGSSISGYNLPLRRPHPLSVITSHSTYAEMTTKSGRYVPHVVTISLETAPLPDHFGVPAQFRSQVTAVANGYRPRLGQVLEACPLDGTKASAVTCVKFAPSADFCLLGYGVREPLSTDGVPLLFHPVTALYRIRGGMTHISTMLSGDDDVNIARFHPNSGYGFVYGTKQGRVRVLSPRPWNYYFNHL